MLSGIHLQGSDPILIGGVFLLVVVVVIVMALAIRSRTGAALPGTTNMDMAAVNRMMENMVPRVEQKALAGLDAAIRKAGDDIKAEMEAQLNTGMSNIVDESRNMVEKIVEDARQSVRSEAASLLSKGGVRREEFERLAKRVESEIGADEVAGRIDMLAKIFDTRQVKTLNWQCRLVRMLRGGLAPDAEEDMMVSEGIPKSAYGRFIKRLIDAKAVRRKNIDAYYMEPEFEWLYGYVESPDLLHSRLTSSEQNKKLEKDYHGYIKNNPDLVEKGLRVQESEYMLDTGPIDLMCRDSEDRPVGVELKFPSATTAVIRQITGYRTDYSKKTGGAGARFIVVAPSIPKKIVGLLAERDIECLEIAFDADNVG